MPRPARPDFPNALYHVFNRGVDRQPIVRDDDDRWNWFRAFEGAVQRYTWRVFAYVLLDNHFHAFFRVREANLSAGMHDFEGRYAALFNRRHDRVGPLFQGRFRSVLVENESHSWELTRYLHLNPVRAGIVTQPLAYLWSSYRHYLNARRAPGWLDWRTVLAEIGRTESTARVAYKHFVDAGLKHPPANPFDGAVDGWILGSEEFAKRMLAAVAEATENGPPTESAVSVDDIMQAIARMFGVPVEQIRQPGRHVNLPREAVALLARQMTGESLEAIGCVLGVGASGVSEIARRSRERFGRDSRFRELVERVHKELRR